MDKLPLYESFKETTMAQKEHIISAIRSKEWKFLVPYFIFCLVVIAVFISGVILAIGSAVKQIDEWMPERNTLPYQKKTINYSFIKKNEIEQNGLYRSEFLIGIHSPIGNSSQESTLGFNLSSEAECTFVWTGFRDMEVRAGLASTTDWAQAKCLTRKPVIDNDKLFIIKDER